MSTLISKRKLQKGGGEGNWKYLVQLTKHKASATRPLLPVVLPCATSPEGGGAVGSDRLAEGSEKPTSHKSRTSTRTERNDAQFEASGRTLGK